MSKKAAASKTQHTHSVQVTLTKSISGRLPAHIATVKGLGLSRIGQSVVLQDTPCIRGMINKVSYLLKVEESAS